MHKTVAVSTVRLSIVTVAALAIRTKKHFFAVPRFDRVQNLVNRRFDRSPERLLCPNPKSPTSMVTSGCQGAQGRLSRIM